jgi:hypothetical protein
VSIYTWIKKYRAEIDAVICAELKVEKNPRANDRERRLWVLNHEGLYLAARREGVRLSEF